MNYSIKSQEVYSMYVNAKSNKQTKTFVKLIRNKFNVDYSARGIQDNGYTFTSVYGSESVFRAYFDQFYKGSNEAENVPAPIVVNAAPIEKTQPTNEANQLAELIAKLAGNSINEEKVIDLIKKHSQGIETTKYISVFNGVERSSEIKVKHNKFDDLMALISAGLNVWITGPAGSGKTHSVHQVAEVLGLDFYAKSVCAQSTQFDFLGYNDANGNFVETDFFRAYKNGGVFCLDEIDNGNANVLSVLNSALANGGCSFACGMVKKHENFICVATANTIGNGGNSQYSGRLQIDKATTDRFTFIHWNYDKTIELSLCGNDLGIYDSVYQIRTRAEKAGLNCIISPRATMAVYRLVSNGMDLGKALEFAIYNKLTSNELQAIKG